VCRLFLPAVSTITAAEHEKFFADKYPLDQSVHPSHDTVVKHVDAHVTGKLGPRLKRQPVPEQPEADVAVVGSTFDVMTLRISLSNSPHLGEHLMHLRPEILIAVLSSR
jgi:hypothetical protein